MSSSGRKRPPSSYRVEQLEPRLLLAADWAMGLAPVWNPDVDDGVAEAELAAFLAEPPLADAATPDPTTDTAPDLPAALDLGALASLQTGRTELVVIDAGVEDYDQLLADLRARSSDTVQYDVRVIAAGADGVAALSSILQEYSNLDAVHLISHGSAGGVQLGDSRLDAANIDQYQDLIRAWSGALAEDADLLFYGCDFASTADGRAFADSLAELTGADVAASTDTTGQAVLGGDWDLEYQTGAIDAGVAFSAAIDSTWSGLLAQTFVVNTLADTVDVTPGDGFALDASGNTSLRAAIMEANAFAGADTITFLGNGTYSLAIATTGEDLAEQGDLDITQALTITGNGAANTIIDGAMLDRVFDVRSADVVIQDLTIQNGVETTDGGGGVRVFTSAELTASRLIITGNSAAGVFGGGLFNLGTASISSSTISGNDALGGAGIKNEGGSTLVLSESTVSGNSGGGGSPPNGGGLQNVGAATITNSTFSGNSGSNGGAISNTAGPSSTVVINSTFSGNTATNNGGAIHVQNGTVSLINSTVTGNMAAISGGALFIAGGTANLTPSNSIFAGNTAPSGNDVQGTVVSDGSNIILDGTGSTGFAVAEIGVDPLLDALADNGGPTLTHALLAGSPAIDSVDVNAGVAPSTDQRGAMRDGQADIGAYEFAATVPADTDGDGLFDTEEDINADLDDDPSTNPGPDTDGDSTPNYLDADDDGDGTPTSAENADPNADGDPRDALDSDHDGQPDYLDLPTTASDGTVASEQKISDTAGGFSPTIDLGDRFGASVAAIGDLNGDGITDIAISAHFDDDAGTDRGAIYIVLLNADGTVASEQKITGGTGGLAAALANDDQFGREVAGVGDIDGDGVPDIVVGAGNDDDGGPDRGAVYLLFMNPDGTVRAEQKISDTAGGLAATLADNDAFGVATTGIGDLDGDGINDIAVGAPTTDDGGSNQGAVYILFLNADGTVKAEQKISSTSGGLLATIDDNDRFGVEVTNLGDLDNDGITDIAVGAHNDDDGGPDRGAVHILFLNADGTVKGEQKISSLSGGLAATLNDGDAFGIALAGIGDANADGIVDLAVGAYLDDDGGVNSDRGAVYILFLNADGTVNSEQKISSTAGGLTGTLDDGDRFGATIAGLGDLNGDGAIDIAVGAAFDDDGGTDRGAVHILNLATSNSEEVLATNNTLTLNEGATATITTALLETTDAEQATSNLIYTLSTTVSNGSLLLSGTPLAVSGSFTQDDIDNNRVTYVHNGGETTTDSFDFTVDDGFGTTTSDTFSITVQPANDGIAGTDGTITTYTDTAYTFSVEDFGATDPVEGDNLLAMIITTAPDAGVLTNGVTTLVGGETVTAAQIAAGDLVFLPDAGDSGNGYTSFTFQVQDDGGTANGGIDTDPTPNTITIDVAAATFWLNTEGNSDPSDTNLDAWNNGDVVAFGEGATLGATSTSGAFTYQFTLTLDDGTPVDADLRALHYVTRTITVGSGADTFTLLEGDVIGALKLPDDNPVTLTSTNTLMVTRKDVFVFRPDLADDYASGTFTMLLENPVAENIHAISLVETTTELGSSGLDLAAGSFLIAHSTPSDHNDVFLYTPTAVGSGTTAGTKTQLLEGSTLGFTEQIQGLELIEEATTIGDRVIAAGQLLISVDEATSVATLPVAAQDIVSLLVTDTEVGGGTTATASILFDGSDVGLSDVAEVFDGLTLAVGTGPANIAPTGADGSVNILEDEAHTFELTDFGFADPVDGDNLLAVKVTTLPGTGTLTNNGTAVTAGDSISALDIDNDLLVYTPVADANGVPSTSFTFQVQDNGGTARGGADLDASPNTLTINITAVNDEPSFTTLGDQAVDEDSGLNTVSGFATALPGGGADEAAQTFSYNVSNDNTGLFAVGPAIDANGQLTYTLAANAVGTATVTVSVTDSGGTANDGEDTSPDQTFDIVVAPVNDEPSFSTLGDQSVDEDSGLNTVAGFATALPGGGADEAAQTFTYAVANDNTGLFAVGPAIDANGQLTYTLNANLVGTATVTVSVKDSGGTANSGDDTSPDQTFDIVVAPVNDEPSFSTLGDQSVDEDSGLNTVAGFATALPGGGADEVAQTFSYAVANDNAGLFVVGPAIDASGQLTYTLAADAVGTATVTVSVTDSGGTTNGGDDTSPDQTFDIVVAPINDEPSFSTLGDQSVDEDSGLNTVAGFATALPGGGADEATQTFSYAVANDNTGLFAVGPAIDANGQLTYTLAANATGTATVTVSVTDSGGTSNGGDDTSPDQTFDIVVAPVNDEPSFSTLGDQRVDEDSGLNTVAGFATALPGGGADESTQTFSYTVGNNNAGLFAVGPAIDANGQLTYTLAADAVGTATVTVSVTDSGGTSNGGDDTSPDQTFDIIVAPVNDTPSFSTLGDQTVIEDSGLNTVAGFATALPGGGADEAGQLFSFAVSNNNAGLFAVGPAIDGSGQLTYTLNTGVFGTATVTVSVKDSGGTVNGGSDTSPTQTFDIVVDQKLPGLWFSSKSDVPSPSDAPGLDAWTDGEVVSFGQPGFNLEPGTTSGLLASVFDIDLFTADTNINALHHVASDITIGTGTTIDLKRGDVLFSLEDDVILTSANTVTITKSDIIAFRPTVTGDYSSGTFTVVLEDPTGSEVEAFTLVEESIVVGDKLLDAGTFLLARKDSNDIQYYTPGSVGQTTTAGGVNALLVDGSDIGMSKHITGIDVVENNMVVGGVTLDAGTILLSVAGEEDLGSTALSVTRNDVFLLDISKTTLVSGIAKASATLLLEGIDVGLDSDKEAFDALTLVPGSATPTDVAAPFLVTNTGGTVLEGGSTSLTTALLRYDDALQAPASVTFVITTAPADGQLEFTADPGTAISNFTQADVNAGLVRYVHNDTAVDPDGFEFLVHDGQGNSLTGETFSIAVTAINDEPSFSTLGDQSVDEDSGLNTVAGFATALPGGGTDEAGQTFTYAVANDNAALFAVGPAIDANGQLTYTLNANVNGTATVTVSVTDSGGTSNGGDDTSPDQTFDIIVAPVNDEPSFSTLGDQSVDEDSGLNTVAGFATALPGGGADESTQTFSYNVSNDNTSLFAVGPAIDASGQLTYTLAADAVGTATVTLSVTDNGGTANGGDDTSPDQTFDITVAAINDEPSFSTLGDQSVDEDSGLNTVAGFATALPGGGADESTQTFSYTVSNDNAGLFAVGPAIDANGQLTYTLNANVNGTATVTLSVTDSGGTINGGDDTSPDQTFDIIVAPINDEPSFTTLGDQSVNEDSGLNTVAGFASALPGGGADEAGQNLSYNVANNNAALFAVGPAINASGQLTYTLNANVNGTATVTVSVTDSGGTANGGDDTSPDQTFDIIVAPINDEPSFSTLGDQSVDEDSGLNTVAGFATALPGGGADEAGQTFTYAVANDNAALFAAGPAIDANGQLTYTLNANVNGTATVTVSVTDSGGTTNGGDNTSPDQTFDIIVAPVNDEPSFTTLGDQSVDEDSGLNTVAGFATALPGGGADEAGQTFTYAVANDNAALFAAGPAIDANGQLTYTLNANVNGTATVAVSVTDSGGTANGGDNTSPDQTFDIIVAPVNDEPSFSTLGDQSVDEDSGLNTVAGFATALPGGGADEAGQTFTYAVANDNAALFAAGPAIDANGQLTYTLNANVNGTATVTLSVTDSGGTSNGGDNTSPDQTFDIIVAPVNDEPSFTILGDQNVDEDSGLNTVAGFASALPGGGADEAGQNLTYTLSNNNAALFAVGPALNASGQLTYTLNANVNGTATVTVSVKDSGGTANGGDDTSPDQTFDIIVAPVNDAPSFSTLGDQSVDEDSGLNTVAGFATALPGGGADEASQTFTYAVANDNATLFAVGPAIDSNGQLTYTLNTNVNGAATVTVSVTDSGGTSNGGDNTSPDQTFDIVVTPVNDEPSFSTLGDQSVDEDSGLNTVSGFATALPGGGADETGQTFIYTVANDNAGLFAVGPAIDTNGELTYTLNANVNGTATVTLSVTDSGGTANGGDNTSPDQTFDIIVAPVNDAPSFSTLGDQSVDEDSGLNTVAGFATALPGGGTDEVAQTFSYTLSNDNTGLFAVGPEIDATGQLTYTLAANAVGTATITVSVTDSGGTANGGDNTSPDQTFDIIVAPVNDEPSLSLLGDQTVDEDSGLNTVAGFASALPGGGADEAGQNLSYSVSNNNAALFAVGPALNASGQLTYTLNANVSGTATVTVSVTDSGGTSNGGDDTSPDQTFDIIVAPINDEPSFSTLGDQSVDEDSGLNTVAGFATALPGGGADEATQTFSYTVSNNNTGLFAVGPAIDATGQLTYTLAANATGTATVTVSVTDSGGTSNGGDNTSPNQTFDIVVAPINDEPSFSTLGDQAVEQDTGLNTVAGFATALPGGGTDESAQTFSYSVSNDNGSLFAVGPAIDANGQLTYTLAANAVGTATVTVSVTDSGGTSNGGDDTSPDQTFDILVTPINDEPSFTTLGDQNVDEDSGLNTVASFATASPGGGADEAGQTFTYAVANNNAALFAVGPAIDANGQLTYTLAANAVGTATVTVSVTDSGGTANGGDDTSPDQTFDIIVAPVNDAPSFSTLGDRNVDEDSGLNTVAGFATALPGGGADEAGQTFTYAVANDNAGLFAVGPAIDANGQLTYTLAADATGTATVTVSVTDSGGTASGGDDTSPAQTFDIIVAPVNNEPFFTTLGDQSVDEDSGLNTVTGFATALPGGGADEAGQTFTYAIANDNAALFAVGPAIDANGQLTYTLAANAVGTATVTVSVTDSGGTANGGDDTSPDQTFDIIVAPVNDEPTFSTLGDQSVDEDSGLNTVAGFATALPGGGTDESAQTFSYTVSNDNAGLFAVGPAIDANGELTYTLAADATGTATVRVSVTDSGGTTNGGDNNSPDQTFDITVTPVADPPAFALLGDQNVDEDSGPITVAGFALPDAGNNTTPGMPATTYSVTHDNAALFAVAPTIASDGTLAYTPADNAFGTAKVVVSLLDADAIPLASESFSITVKPVNDAPTGADASLVTLGNTPIVFTVDQFGFKDPVDGDALIGIQITAVPTAGSLEVNGAAVSVGDTVKAEDITAGKLRYIPPVGDNTSIPVGFSYRVQDAGGTEAGGTDLAPTSNRITIQGSNFGSPQDTTPVDQSSSNNLNTSQPAEEPAGEEANDEPAQDAPVQTVTDTVADPDAASRDLSETIADDSILAQQFEVSGIFQTTSAATRDTGGPAQQETSTAALLRALLPEALELGQVRDPWNLGITQDDRPEFTATRSAIQLGIDAVRNAADEETIAREINFNQSTGAVLTLSVGYLSWLLRGGVLLTSVLSSLPAWRFIDPLPVFAAVGAKRGDDDDESLEDIVEGAPQLEPESTPAHTLSPTTEERQP